jgi:hypothetical protein
MQTPGARENGQSVRGVSYEATPDWSERRLFSISITAIAIAVLVAVVLWLTH